MTETERIECKVAPWYFRRMGLMTLLLAGCGGWFMWDGLVGWPKANHKADIYEAFQAGREETSWDEFVAEKEEEDWAENGPGDDGLAEAKEAYNAAAGGESWSSFSVERRLPEHKPKRHPQSAIEGQFHWAYGAFGFAAVVLVVMLVNAPKKLSADAEAFYTPGHARVPYDRIFRVDKKKWDNKGLAYAYYRDEGEKVKKATIDDLKFKGADRILDLVLARFEGELIERAPLDDDEAEEEREDNEDGREEKEGDASAAAPAAEPAVEQSNVKVKVEVEKKASEGAADGAKKPGKSGRSGG